MAVTITATVGSATANSFVTLAEADAYLEARVNASAWTGDEDNKVALVDATREVSSLPFQGWRTDAVQALSFPRSGVPDPDAPADAVTGLATDTPEYATDVIPQRVKDATIELALEFRRAGTTDIAGADTTVGVIEKTVDVLTTRWQPHSRRVGLARYPRIMARLEPLLEPSREVTRR